MAILFIQEGVKKPKLKYRVVTKWLKRVISKYGYENGDLTYIFCNDEFLKIINSKYLNHDYYTDIVTFDYCNNKIVSGDMFISVDRVRENSVKFCCDEKEEFLRVMIHGLLHLFGFNDSNKLDRESMRKREDECLLLFSEVYNENIR